MAAALPVEVTVGTESLLHGCVDRPLVRQGQQPVLVGFVHKGLMFMARLLKPKWMPVEKQMVAPLAPA
jgi:hypothetical protein